MSRKCPSCDEYMVEVRSTKDGCSYSWTDHVCTVCSYKEQSQESLNPVAKEQKEGSDNGGLQ